VWDIAKNACISMNRFFDLSITTLAFHPKGDFIAVASGNRVTIWEWSRDKGNVEKSLEGATSFPDTGSTGSGEGRTNEEQRKLIWRGIKHTRNFRALMFHPSGNFLFAAAPDAQRGSGDILNYCRY
jgi:WD40 repeat protein